MHETLLVKAGFSDKAAKTYLALLKSGPQSVRKLSQATGVNRGTTYDILKELQNLGAVSFFHKEKKQYFVAEDPESILRVLEARQQELSSVYGDFRKELPTLRALRDAGTAKPVTRYYEGSAGIKRILERVLNDASKVEPPMYRVYSALNVRDHLYKDWPDFNKSRIGRGIRVRAVSLGEGGELCGLDERRWLSRGGSSPSYMFITHKAVAMVSVRDDGEVIGVIVDDPRTAETQALIFDSLWERLNV